MHARERLALEDAISVLTAVGTSDGAVAEVIIDALRNGDVDHHFLVLITLASIGLQFATEAGKQSGRSGLDVMRSFARSSFLFEAAS